MQVKNCWHSNNVERMCENILHEFSIVKTLCARWVAHFLIHVTCIKTVVYDSKAQFGDISAWSKWLLCRFLTLNEMWIHHYTPESLRQSHEGLKPSINHPKWPKTQHNRLLSNYFWWRNRRWHIYQLSWERIKITREWYVVL